MKCWAKIFLLAIWVVMSVVAWSQTPRSQDQLKVMDADNSLVGAVVSIDRPLGFGIAPVVAFKIDQFFVVLAVLPEGFTAVDSGQIVWQSSDCSGSPFFLAGYTSVFGPPVAVGLPGNTVYTADGDIQTISIRSASALSTDPTTGAPTGRQKCAPFIAPVRVYAAHPLGDLDSEFKPPYKVR